MHHFDTSFLAPLILEEATSSAVERFLAGLPADILAVSHWTRVEFSSLLAGEVRMGGMSSRAAREADNEFEAIIAESFAVFAPAAQDFGLAKATLPNLEPDCAPATRSIWRSRATTAPR